MIRCACRWALSTAAIVCTLSLGASARAALTTPGSPAAIHHRHAIRRLARRTSHPARIQTASAVAPPAAPAAPPAPPRPTDMAPQPATVTLRNGRLTVVANNSDLGQILRTIASDGGMTVSGFSNTARVFGVYGPGAPGDVLTDLLSGSGYNFIMSGETASGAPRELVLTAQTGGPYVPAPSSDQDNEAGPPPWQKTFGPGALPHVPPSQYPNQMTPQERMQQHIEQLQRLRQPFAQQPQQQ